MQTQCIVIHGIGFQCVCVWYCGLGPALQRAGQTRLVVESSPGGVERGEGQGPPFSRPVCVSMSPGQGSDREINSADW
eukprot:5438414-Lingulodinium_polyedra.AAC.1